MPSTYHPFSILWHWLIAAVLILAFVLVLSVDDTPGFTPEKLKLMNWHKWAGISVLVLTFLRIITRLIYPAPPLGADVRMPAWQKRIHQFTLFAMLTLCLAIPLVGWTMSSAKGFPVVWFGVVQLPDLVAKDKALGHNLADLHEILAWSLAALVGLHTAAALKHRLINKDSVLQRMLPWVK